MRYGDFVPSEFRPWAAPWGPPKPFLFLGELLGDPSACVNCGQAVTMPPSAAPAARAEIIVFPAGVQCQDCTRFLAQLMSSG